MFSQSACDQRIDAKTAIIIKRAHLGRADFSMVEVKAFSNKNFTYAHLEIYHVTIEKSSDKSRKV